MKKIFALILALAMLLALTACGGQQQAVNELVEELENDPELQAAIDQAVSRAKNDTGVYTIGICNYVDDASLNQIVENIENRLARLARENDVTFDIDYDNCNADANVLEQIIANFIADGVDLMIGVATPVAMAMQAATEDNGIPVVFAAVSDPVGVGVVDSLDAPGGNVTGTSDYLDTTAVMNLMFAVEPEASLIALLYDMGQDASTTAIAEAKAYLDRMAVPYKEYTGTTIDEISLAVDALIADGAAAVFTPQDNTVMTAELSIYEALAEAGIPHYTGADSFALNGAFVGYGVDYANLGVETADMVADILLNDLDVASVAVRTFDNGTATVNTETCEALGYDFQDISARFAPYCTQVVPITTEVSFSDLQ